MTKNGVGAVRASGERAESAVPGSGYVELTGYAGSMQGQSSMSGAYWVPRMGY